MVEKQEPPAWSPLTWRDKPIVQDVSFEDKEGLDSTIERLQALPPLVTAQEIDRLRRDLAEVAEGKAFLLQGGDCAELFAYCNAKQIETKVRLLLQMSLVLIWGANIPVVRVGRMAGQYAKPRSSPMEQCNGTSVHSFRGDILNGYDIKDRKPNPDRLLQAYFHSAATLNYLRGLLSSDFADLHKSFDWSLGHVRSDAVRKEYQEIVESLNSALSFMKTIGADKSTTLGTVDLYTSHEGLVLDYEQPLTRRLSDANGVKAWYDTSAHMIWIGDRTRQVTHAHVEFFRGVKNAIGVKVGPSMENEELMRILAIVDPDREKGKLVLITRYGHENIQSKLGAHIRAVKSSGHRPVWACDPMHGNTHSTAKGIKTRQFSHIMSEIKQAIKIHTENGSRLNGVHLELTGDPVTECIGGSEGLTTSDLDLRYTSYCDPRLNEKQALDVAFMVASHYREASFHATPKDGKLSST